MLTELTLESHLEHRGEGAWRIVDDGRTLAEMRWPDLRISLSWKARVFPDRHALDRYVDHKNDLTIEEVFSRFAGDLTKKGIAFPESTDPIHDESLMEILAQTYMRTPTEFEPLSA